jgi:arsenite methyltransferase
VSDLMHQEEIRGIVRDAYSTIPSGAGAVMAARLYSPEELAEVPDQSIAWSLGVGNPVRHADLVAGEVVIDLGCGGGIDTILAARRVGPAGRVVAVDTLPEMCERTEHAAVEAGVAERVEVVNAEMEDLPVPAGSVDVVISNGVINLSPRKSRALAEAAQVLRPGGRVCVSDLTVDDEHLPEEILTSGAAWAGCIAGALSEEVFTTKLANVGFTDIRLGEHVPFSVDDAALYPLFTEEVITLMRDLVPPEAQASIATSLIARARLTEAV